MDPLPALAAPLARAAQAQEEKQRAERRPEGEARLVTLRHNHAGAREMLPDPAFFADCLRAGFVRMKEAAAREAAFVSADSQASPAKDASLPQLRPVE